MEDGENEQGHVREVRTPPCSPVLPWGRRPRSPTRRRACSRERRSRSRTSQRSMGRLSRCSSRQPAHRLRYKSNQRSRSRSISRRSPDYQLSSSRRHGSNQDHIDRAVCLSSEAGNRAPNYTGGSRSRSRVRSPSHSHNYRHSERSRRLNSASGLPLDADSRGRSSRFFTNRTERPIRRKAVDDGVTKCNSDLAELVQTLLNANNDSLNKLGSMNNTIPEFDPSRKEQTMSMWLHKVNECAIIYKWSERQVIHFALPKLKGLAQRWYESLSSVLHSWDEWQHKLLSAFPSEENHGQMLSDMLARRARFSDSLEDYFYDKVALLNRCGITGKRAVDCVIHGIDDRSIKLGAEAAQFNDPDKLLTFLRNAKSSRQTNDRRLGKAPVIGRNTENSRPYLSKTLRCTNCKKDGHTTTQCALPIRKCNRCNRIGHETEQCYAKLPSLEKPEKTV